MPSRSPLSGLTEAGDTAPSGQGGEHGGLGERVVGGDSVGMGCQHGVVRTLLG